jgi:hypothetical protein
MFVRVCGAWNLSTLQPFRARGMRTAGSLAVADARRRAQLDGAVVYERGRRVHHAAVEHAAGRGGCAEASVGKAAAGTGGSGLTPP